MYTLCFMSGQHLDVVAVRAAARRTVYAVDAAVAVALLGRGEQAGCVRV